MRIVIDTNIVASAIFFGGRPRELSAFISQEIIEEYQGTIEYLQNEYPSKRITVPLTQIRLETSLQFRRLQHDRAHFCGQGLPRPRRRYVLRLRIGFAQPVHR